MTVYELEGKIYKSFNELWEAGEELHPELSEDSLLEFLERTATEEEEENC